MRIRRTIKRFFVGAALLGLWAPGLRAQDLPLAPPIFVSETPEGFSVYMTGEPGALTATVRGALSPGAEATLPGEGMPTPSLTRVREASGDFVAPTRLKLESAGGVGSVAVGFAFRDGLAGAGRTDVRVRLALATAAGETLAEFQRIRRRGEAPEAVWHFHLTETRPVERVVARFEAVAAPRWEAAPGRLVEGFAEPGRLTYRMERSEGGWPRTIPLMAAAPTQPEGQAMDPPEALAAAAGDFARLNYLRLESPEISAETLLEIGMRFLDPANPNGRARLTARLLDADGNDLARLTRVEVDPRAATSPAAETEPIRMRMSGFDATRVAHVVLELERLADVAPASAERTSPPPGEPVLDFSTAREAPPAAAVENPPVPEPGGPEPSVERLPADEAPASGLNVELLRPAP